MWCNQHQQQPGHFSLEMERNGEYHIPILSPKEGSEMMRPFLTLSGFALLSLCGANTEAQPNRPARQENNLTREQVRDAYKAIKDFGCTYAGYERDARSGKFTSRYAASANVPGLPKDPLDYLRYVAHFNLHYWSDRTWSSYAMRLPDKTGDGDIRRLATPLQQLPYLRAIDAGGLRIGDASAKALAAIPDLEALFLDGTAMGDSGLNELADAGGLTWLDISRTRVTDKGMEHVARQRNLRVLFLADNAKISDKGLHEISALGQLHTLDLSGTGIELSGKLDLSAWRNLIRLDLSGCPVGDEGLKALAKLSALEELDLSGTNVSGAGLAYLTDLRKLRTLRLTDAPVTDEGAKGIGALKQIRILHLNNSEPADPKAAKLPGKVQIGDDGLAALGGCKSLRELNLARTGVRGRGFEAFAKHPFLRDIDLEGTPVNPGAFLEIRNIPNLRNLNLARTPITGDGLQTLSEQRFLTRLNLEESKANDAGMAFVFRLGALRELNLQGTAITSAGVKALGENSLVQLNIGQTKVNNDAFRALSGMRSLRALYVFGTPLAANGVNQFKTPLPECTVITAPPKPPARNVDHAPRLPVES
jgi:hypothetical protein